MKRKTNVLVSAAFCLSTFATAQAHAENHTPPPTEEELRSAADRVVSGVVSGIHVHRAGPGPLRGIYTEVILDVFQDADRGAVRETVSVWIPGGQFDGQRRVVRGAPEFAVGESTTIYLRSRAGALVPAFGQWSRCLWNGTERSTCASLPGTAERPSNEVSR